MKHGPEQHRTEVIAKANTRTRAGVSFPPLLLALTLSVALPHALRAEGGGNGGAPDAIGVAQREATRRQEQIRNAQELLTDAELDRREGKYADAVEKYRTAYLSLPRIPATAALRDSIFKRYQQASVEYAGELIEQARWEDAEAVLAQVMKDARDSGMAPGTVNPEVRTLLTRLRSDDYFNKAMSPAHLANVETVEKLLAEAKGATDLGDLTKAKRAYESVLNVDRFNTAARRGLEVVNRMIMEYSEVARTQTRAEMLREVSEAWESEVPRVAPAPEGFEVTVEAVGAQKAAIQEKINRITLPNVEFASTPLQTVVEYLTQVAQDLDTTEPDPTKRGINIVIDPSSATQAADIRQRPITLSLSRAPLSAVLQYVAQQAELKYRVDAYAVTLVPLSAADDAQLITRTFSVPPDFISGQGAQAGGGGGGPVDPFAAPDANAGAGSVVKRVSAQEFLENSGVTFPPGSLATFNASNSTLIVKNTPDNMELIEQMVISSKTGGTKLVMIDIKVIETTQAIINELGFDWLLGQFNLPGQQKVFGSGGTVGNSGATRVVDDVPFAYPSGLPVGPFPLTAGLRSGNSNVTRSIDDVIARDSVSSGMGSAAPGVFALSGPFTDPQFQTVIRALAQDQGTDFLSTASVLTRPGERAIIKQVREFIYPTEYDPPEIPQTVGFTQIGNVLVEDPVTGSVPVAPATPAAFATRELGTIIEVTPTISADNVAVDLDFIVDRSEFSGFINYGSPINQSIPSDPYGFRNFFGLPVPSPTFLFTVTENRILSPVFDALKETSKATIYDGQTIAIGGLISDQFTKVEDKVPLLGDAPLVGQMFRSERSEITKRALVLFATVRILDPGGKPINDLSQMSSESPVATVDR